MRVCLKCRSRTASFNSKCETCGFEPPILAGIVHFAPDLAADESGMPNSHKLLYELQASNYWFRSRNRLIGTLAAKYCHGVRSVMEIGCGTGLVLQALRAAFPGARLLGSELATEALRFASKSVGPDVELLQMDAGRIPFEEEFDVVGAFDVIEHLDDDLGMLCSVRHALRPGGVALLAAPQHPWLWSASDEFARHRRRYRSGELAAKMREAGFSILFQGSFVFTLLPLLAISRLAVRTGRPYDPLAEYKIPRSIGRLLETALNIETKAIALGLRFPFGGSSVVVGQRV